MSVTESEREMAALVAACALTDVKRLAKAFQQFKQENYARGFEAAKAAALAAIEDTDTVECNHSYYAQLGDASATKSNILEAVRKIEFEVTR